MNKKNKTSTFTKVVLIGDSLMMPRPDEKVFYEDTYGYLLKKELEKTGKFLVVSRAKRKNYTSIQVDPDNLLYDIKNMEPDLVCIHLGIVDCAPRLFTPAQYEVVRNLPAFIRRIAIKILSKNRKFFTKHFPKVYVKEDNFEKNMQKLLEFVKENSATPVLINIARPSEENVTRSHNFLKHVKEYNSILGSLAKKNNCKLINMYESFEAEPGCLMADGIHLSKKGHKIIMKELSKHIREIGNIK